MGWSSANVDITTDGMENREVRRFYDAYFVTHP
jgi:hypothetical protein